MTVPAKPLPKYLVQRYKGWCATELAENHAWYARLAEEGQRPRAMVISCCDSRVPVTGLFGADTGELFIHRNIANLVPPYNPEGELLGTSAAVEYAVSVLHVSNLMVLGHSRCGGVEECLEMNDPTTPNPVEGTIFVDRWMEILSPKVAEVKDIADREERLRALERKAVLASLENLLTFPFVKDAVTAGQLALHGLWNDIGSGALEYYDPERNRFLPV